MIDKKLLEILACPACQGVVVLKDEMVCCLQCGRKYPVHNGIPVMLDNEAQH